MNIQSTIDLPPGGRRRQALRQALMASYLERIIQIVEAGDMHRRAVLSTADNTSGREIDRSIDLRYAVDIAHTQE